MGRGGQKREVVTNGNTHIKHQEYGWSEIKRHTDRNDKWIVIDGEVYDVTNWSKRHPGGSRLLSHYAGQDATEAFEAFHNHQKAVRKFLKPLHIGSVEDYLDNEINRDFRLLKQEAVKMGLFTPSITFFTFMVGHIIGLQLLSYFLLHWYGTSWPVIAISLVCFAAAQIQCGWTHHDFGHQSVFQSSYLNHLVHNFLVGIMKGASSNWWNHLHYQHHAKPNVINKDPDVRLEALFVVGKEMPLEVAKNKNTTMPYNQQHKYFFAIGPPLLYPVYFQIMLFRHMIIRRLWKELAYALTFYFAFLFLYVPILGVGGALLFYFLMRVIESHWFTWVSQSNHIPMNIKSDEESPWLKLQMHATCDIEKGFFNDWFTGHLNFQVEHHLFPTMPRHNLYKIAPQVKELCEKHGVPYIVKPIGTAFWDIVRSLKSSGQLWKDAYDELHHD